MPKPKGTRTAAQQMLLQPTYDPRFFEDAIGRLLLFDAKTAIIELIANAWDAYAEKVVIELPNAQTGKCFSIEDDGSGMTPEEFFDRWMKLSYNRVAHQGLFAEKPPGFANLPDRKAFGKNGKGRHAAFCFCKSEFFIKTCKNGFCNSYRVFRPESQDKPFESEILPQVVSTHRGTKIFSEAPVDIGVSPEELRAEIGMRFLLNPRFEVIVDGVKVDFEHIPNYCHITTFVEVPGVGQIKVITIDTHESDKTTRLHGIAWQVQGRLVGEASWKNFGDEKFIDGRSSAAKRFSFIVQADCLADRNCMSAEWSSFNQYDKRVKLAFEYVNEHIRTILLQQTAEDRKQTFGQLKYKNAELLKRMGPRNAEIWVDFVSKVLTDCPSISERELESIAQILAKLEASKSLYAVLYKLQECSSEDFDALNEIMDSWTIETAKIVLDELEKRLRVIAELEIKMLDKNTDEVQDLQPIFKNGLWIFGPEFESIEFTSNQTMTTAIQKLFNKNVEASKCRPDFAVLPDGSVSFHSLPSYDNISHEEDGVQKLVIIELKKPEIALGSKEQDQCWKYVKEFLETGAITESTKVDCFLLGSKIQPREEKVCRKGDNCVILPMTYQTVIGRAKARTLSLYKRVRSAPFLDAVDVDMFLNPTIVDANIQISLFDQESCLQSELQKNAKIN